MCALIQNKHLRSVSHCCMYSIGPAWTPLFAYIGAVVMQTGGTLSHGAVVAREFEVPAVSNIRGVTESLQTGQMVEVDGNEGTVTVLSSSDR